MSEIAPNSRESQLGPVDGQPLYLDMLPGMRDVGQIESQKLDEGEQSVEHLSIDDFRLPSLSVQNDIEKARKWNASSAKERIDVSAGRALRYVDEKYRPRAARMIAEDVARHGFSSEDFGTIFTQDRLAHNGEVIPTPKYTTMLPDTDGRMFETENGVKLRRGWDETPQGRLLIERKMSFPSFMRLISVEHHATMLATGASYQKYEMELAAALPDSIFKSTKEAVEDNGSRNLADTLMDMNSVVEARMGFFSPFEVVSDLKEYSRSNSQESTVTHLARMATGVYALRNSSLKFDATMIARLPIAAFTGHSSGAPR